MARNLQSGARGATDQPVVDRRGVQRRSKTRAPSQAARSRRGFGEARGPGYLRADIAGRFAAGLYLLIGIRAVVTLPGQRWTSQAFLETAAIGVVACCCALVFWFLRWEGKLPRHARTLELGAFVLLAVSNWVDPNPWAYGALFSAVFVWVGLVRTVRQTALAIIPALIAYLVPLALQPTAAHAWIGMVNFESGIGAVATVVISGILGVALAWSGEQLRQVETLGRRRLSGLESVLASTVELAEPLEPALVTDMVTQISMQAFGADAAILFGAANTPDALMVLQHRHWNSAQLHMRVPFPSTLATELAQGKAISAPDGWLPELSEQSGETRLVPLFSADGLVGVIGLWWRWSALGYGTRLDEDLASTFGRQAGAALQRAYAFGALQHATMLDALTGLGNRRAAEAYLDALAPGDAIVMIDLDHFKRVNDERGHAAGDRALRELGAFLAGALREGDRVARYGGEEFIMMVRNIHPAAVESLLERLRLLWNDRSPITTFSIGAAVHQRGVDPRATLQAADIALYQAKERGRDQVVVAA
ncbi:MAG: diguanylate cyclase domain-containing protein [Acidimicrobiia bacterium]